VTDGLARRALFLVLDQMKYEYIKTLERIKPNLNLLQLKKKSASFSKAFVKHLPTSSAPGHAIISTGTVPSLNGIVSSNWFDREKMKNVEAVETYDSKNLYLETLAKSAKMMGFRVAVVAGKIDSAILLGGDIADLTLFPFPFQFADGKHTLKFVDQKDVVAKYKLEKDKDLLLNVHDLEHTPIWIRDADLHLLLKEKYSTKLDLKTCEALSLVLENEFHNTDDWMLLASFGSTDYIGHDQGPASRAVYDNIVSLDEQLGKILEAPALLNALICLTSDHGCTRICHSAKVYAKEENGRPTFQLAIFDAEREQVKSIDFPEYVAKHICFEDTDNFGFIGEGIALVYLKQDEEQVIELVKNYFLEELGDLVQEAYGRRDNLPEEVEALMSDRSGDMVLIPKDNARFLNVKWDAPKGEHGSLGEDDQHIPLLIKYLCIKPDVYETPIRLQDVVPMIKFLLDLPCTSDERRIGESLTKLIKIDQNVEGREALD